MAELFILLSLSLKVIYNIPLGKRWQIGLKGFIHTRAAFSHKRCFFLQHSYTLEWKPLSSFLVWPHCTLYIHRLSPPPHRWGWGGGVMEKGWGWEGSSWSCLIHPVIYVHFWSGREWHTVLIQIPFLWSYQYTFQYSCIYCTPRSNPFGSIYIEWKKILCSFWN